MPTSQKAQIIAETSARFQESKGVYFTRYTGMSVLQATSLRKQFRENNIEYVDILCHGFRNHVLENIGFLKKTTKQKIPNHFEPYTGKDTKLNFCILINKYKKNIILLKGDGDQDRPNLIKMH